MGKINLLNDEKAEKCPHTYPHQQKKSLQLIESQGFIFFSSSGDRT